VSNATKFHELLESRDHIRCESGYGGGMLWVALTDQRDGKTTVGVCTDPASRYHREGDLPLTDEGVEELYARLSFELEFGV
jgi:hypothetical protein